jgi:F1F0 ATPase subunit 2
MTLTQFLLTYVYPLIIGLGLGLIYYGGLWLILRKLPEFNQPGAWVAISLVLRILVVLLVLYLLFAESWQQLMMAVLGMLITRTLLVQRIKPGPQRPHKSNKAAP